MNSRIRHIFLIASVLYCGTTIFFPHSAIADPAKRELWKPTDSGQVKSAAFLEVYQPDSKPRRNVAVIVFGDPIEPDRNQARWVAQWLNLQGFAAAVMHYDPDKTVPYADRLRNARRAVRVLRAGGAATRFERRRVGVWGMRGGANIAANLGALIERGRLNADDPVERQDSRPDFQILTNGAISFVGSYADGPLRDALLGKDSPASLRAFFSPERNVSSDAPPTFILHLSNEKDVPPENSIEYYLAMQKAGAPCALHMYEETIGVGQSNLGSGKSRRLLRAWLRDARMMVSWEEKARFFEALRKAPVDGEFFAEEAIDVMAPHLGTLVALTRKDLAELESYALLTLMRLFIDDDSARGFLIERFGDIRHEEIKLGVATMLLDTPEEITSGIRGFLKRAINVPWQRAWLQGCSGPNWKETLEQIEKL